MRRIGGSELLDGDRMMAANFMGEPKKTGGKHKEEKRDDTDVRAI
jgi:hypothetical protein